MRIISPFRDYYDSSQGLGIDPNLIYNRKTEQVKVFTNDFPLNLTHLPKTIWGSYLNKSLRNNLTCYYLFFCGKVYTSIDLSLAVNGESSPVFANKWESIKHSYENQIPKNKFWGIDSKLKQLQSFNEKEAPTAVFEFLDCPVFLWKGEHFSHTGKVTIIKNPSLINLGFQHVVDSYTAFQTISIYLGNELCTKEQPPTPTNEEIIRSTGHDARLSFRGGSPGAKKVRRKRNKSRKRNSIKSF